MPTREYAPLVVIYFTPFPDMLAQELTFSGFHERKCEENDDGTPVIYLSVDKDGPYTTLIEHAELFSVTHYHNLEMTLEELTELYRQLEHSEHVKILEKLSKRSWGDTAFAVIGPDGNRTVYSVPTPKQDAVSSS